MIPLIPALATLAVQQGPALIRGISSWFGGSSTADKLADIVEQVSGLGLTASQQEAAVSDQLARITDPAALVELQKLKVEMEKEQTRRQDRDQQRHGKHQLDKTDTRLPAPRPFIRC